MYIIKKYVISCSIVSRLPAPIFVQKRPDKPTEHAIKSVACRGGAEGATAPGIHSGGIQRASFLLKM